MLGHCSNDYEHERQARRDAERGRYDYEMYDRYTSDPCKESYTEEYDRERRRIEDRQQEEREQEEYEERRQARAAAERREIEER